MKHERLWTLGNKLRALGRRGVRDLDRPVMGSREGTYCIVHWVLYATEEASNFTSASGMYCMVTNII